MLGVLGAVVVVLGAGRSIGGGSSSVVSALRAAHCSTTLVICTPAAQLSARYDALTCPCPACLTLPLSFPGPPCRRTKRFEANVWMDHKQMYLGVSWVLVGGVGCWLP